jgi:hypothetical protein
VVRQWIADAAQRRAPRRAPVNVAGLATRSFRPDLGRS